MRSTILALTRIFFVVLGVACIISGFIVFAVLPIAFLVALLTEVTGVAMLICAWKADVYTDWDKIDAG